MTIVLLKRYKRRAPFFILQDPIYPPIPPEPPGATLWDALWDGDWDLAS